MYGKEEYCVDFTSFANTSLGSPCVQSFFCESAAIINRACQKENSTIEFLATTDNYHIHSGQMQHSRHNDIFFAGAEAMQRQLITRSYFSCNLKPIGMLHRQKA